MRPVALLVLLSACGPDLPPGWEGADPIPDLVQRQCAGSPYDGDYEERVEADGGAGKVDVALRETVFRCAQDVEGFALAGDGTLDVLVQPIDMHPSAVAGCDCLYDVEMTLDADAGDVVVSAWRRWDSYAGVNDPVAVGEVTVTVQ